MRARYKKNFAKRQNYWIQKETLAHFDNHSFDKSQKVVCSCSCSKAHLNNSKSNNPLKFSKEKNYSQNFEKTKAQFGPNFYYNKSAKPK